MVQWLYALEVSRMLIARAFDFFENGWWKWGGRGCRGRAHSKANVN